MGEPTPFDAAAAGSAHLVGIGGAGMSALARLLRANGWTVSGTDRAPSAVLEALAADGFAVAVGHRPDWAREADVVAASTAVPPDDADLAAAREAGVPVRSRADVLAGLTRLRRTLAVAGTHGKTTTTAMTATALRGAGVDPSFLVGGVAPGLDGGAWWGSGAWFVVEADESDGTFLALSTGAVVLTNAEADHLDHWGTWDRLAAAFVEFLAACDGPRLVCADDPGAHEAGLAAGASSYGLAAGATYRIEAVSAVGTGSAWRVRLPGGDLVEVALPVPGLHNVRNATAALAVGVEVGADPAALAAALATYGGVGRRFEHRGEAGGVTVVDDYAHLPAELAATLAAARGGPWRRVVAVFQPHRYSRTAALGAELGRPLAVADVVFVTDVYAAGEAPIAGVDGRVVADGATGAGAAAVHYVPGRADLVDAVVAELRPGDLCLTLGAGDVTTLADPLLARLGGSALPGGHR